MEIANFGEYKVCSSTLKRFANSLNFSGI